MVIEVEANNRFDLSSTSKGNQIKWFQNNMYIKADSMGYEGFAEVLTSELLKYIDIPFDYIDYFPCEIKEKGRQYSGCYSYNYLTSNECFISIARLLECRYKNIDLIYKKYVGKALVDFIIQFIKEQTGLDITEYLSILTKFDYLILNEDRHFNNINLIYNSITKAYKLGPIFDNGLSLLSDTTDYDILDTISANIKQVKSKPFSNNFNKQVAYFDNKPLKIDIQSYYKALEKHKDLYENNKYYIRAVNVLNRQLRGLEGKIWVKN